MLLDGSAAAATAVAGTLGGSGADWAQQQQQQQGQQQQQQLGPGGDAAALQAENQELREQLDRALQAAQQWGRLNAQLQELCADRLVAPQAT